MITEQTTSLGAVPSGLSQPIFIVGTGRCGSTIFDRLLSYHPQVAWLSRACEMYPHRPERNQAAMRLLDSPLPQRLVRKLVYPVEPYRFWDTLSPGFSEPHRDLVAEDVTPQVKQKMRRVLGGQLTPRRQRLQVKLTGWPRISFIKEVFPDAKFIHIYRDGRAVVNSLLQVDWWSGWYGPERWRWGALSPEQIALWQKHQQSFVALAAIEWLILMDAYQTACEKIPAEDMFEVRYEDFCAQPIETLQQVCRFSQLAWDEQFEATLRQFEVKNADHKWKTQLTPAQQDILHDCLADTLQMYGYLV